MTVGGDAGDRLTWKLFDFRPWPTNTHSRSRLAAPSRIFLGAKMRIEERDFQLIEYPYLEGDHHPSTAGQFIRPLEQLRFLHSHALVHGDIHRGNIVFGKKPVKSLFPGEVDVRQIFEFKRTLESRSGRRLPAAAASEDSSAVSSAVAIRAADKDDKSQYERPSSSLIDFDMMGITGYSYYASNFRWEFADPAFGRRRLLGNDKDRYMVIEDDTFSMWYLMQLFCVSDAGASSAAVASDSDAAQAWQLACNFVQQNNLSRAIECLLTISDVCIIHVSANSGLSASASNMHQEQGAIGSDRKPLAAVQNSSKSSSGSSLSSSQQSSFASIAEVEPEAAAAVSPAAAAAVSAPQ